MKRHISRRPAGHKTHPRLRRDGRFRIVWLEGKAGTEDLMLRQFVAYVRGIERAQKRSLWGKRLRIKKRFGTRWSKGRP
ncbi:hypothetical protein RA210_U70013 [Rubrivivax sp. A210]|uniref:hypothetical protein n=1 Tax=Rubrivivax sp. A210 TaxID=2772301 RepID=UPI001919D2B6|nr:hypothetical protein [Rubrivivax sp. A210]CAD5374697.1 hypothetical protein RA210_U70013 [Rubrivivax sp. A210]